MSLSSILSTAGNIIFIEQLTIHGGAGGMGRRTMECKMKINKLSMKPPQSKWAKKKKRNVKLLKMNDLIFFNVSEFFLQIFKW